VFLNREDRTMIRYVDLFCGLGAFHTAFNTDPHFKCVFACDIDAGIRSIYKQNYGIDVHDDIRTIDCEKMPDFEVLCAGFPCQPFSIAGNGEGFNDKEKGNLFYDILRILDVKQPRMCILENVKNLRTHDSGNTYKTIETELGKRGYLVTSKVLTASDFGSPQARQRIFIVATKNQPFEIPEGTGVVRTVSSILEANVSSPGLNSAKYDLEEKKSVVKSLSSPKILYNVVDKQTRKGGRQGERVYDVSHVGITVCASSGGPGAKTGLYKVGDTIRRLTVKETVGMFGFPTDYDFGETLSEHALFYLGNSIVVDVIKAFVPRIVDWFTKPAELPLETI
jgi:DNA (cytosine-5)-methyltransferase 1